MCDRCGCDDLRSCHHSHVSLSGPLALFLAVNFDNVAQVVIGSESAALAKLKANSKVASEFFSRSTQLSGQPGQYFLSGFLQKKGGSKGGRRNWTKVPCPHVPPVHICDVGDG